MRSEDFQPIAAWMVMDPHWQTYGMTVSSVELDFRGALERGDLLLTAGLDNHAAGFVWCVPRGMFGAHPYLKRIGVDPAVAGRSIGTLLMDELERRLAATGATYLYLLVGSENPRAEQFYQQRGFTMLVGFPGLAVDGIEERLYRKDLAALSY